MGAITTELSVGAPRGRDYHGGYRGHGPLQQRDYHEL